MNLLHFPAIVFCFALAGCTSTPEVAENPQTPVSADATTAEASGPEIDEPVIANDYILGQGDTISIQVFDEPDLTLDTVVGSNGSINYSYLGDVKVTGKSPSQLERHIAGLLQNGYLVNPSVNVTVIQYRSFYINGEVRRPGGYPYQPGLTLDKAIALAGGLTDRASTRKMFLTKGAGAEGSQKETRASLNSRIEPGDIITIKEGFF